MTEKLTSEQIGNAISKLRACAAFYGPSGLGRKYIESGTIAVEEIETILSHIAALEAELSDWRSCAMYDAMMEGPRFKGWNQSALNRCRADYVETWATHPTSQTVKEE